jgi:hypothetical protein
MSSSSARMFSDATLPESRLSNVLEDGKPFHDMVNPSWGNDAREARLKKDLGCYQAGDEDPCFPQAWAPPLHVIL